MAIAETEIQDKLADLESRLATAEGALNLGTTGGFDTRLDALESADTAADARLDAVEADVATAQDDITALDTRVTALENP